MQRIVTILTALALLTLGFYFFMIIRGFVTAPEYIPQSSDATAQATADMQEVSLSPEEQALYEEGKGLYRTNCSSCHAIQQQRIGPKMAGVTEKYAGEEEWLYQWIKNAPAMISAGDPKATALYEEYSPNMMSAFPALTTENIDAILTYVEVESEKG